MPNHYHFLLRQDGEVSLSRFINVAFNVYVQALNKQLERKGTLFEGRFKHVLVDKDEYILYLCRYIH
ncbi:MAG: transposase [Candidatus Latescibacteria bacterium]|nr:transposase [Candidatus Latescibacterota bacterium]